MAFNRNTYSGMTLKALLENPDLQRAPAVLSGGPGPKDKKGNEGDIDFTSAFLGPQLWDKTYNADDFNLEYMDLDEFLSENGIPVVETPGLDQLVASPAPPSPSSMPLSPSLTLPLQDPMTHLQTSPAPSPMPPSPPTMVLNPPPAPTAVAPLPVTPAAVVAPPAQVRVMNATDFIIKPKLEKTEDLVVSNPEVQAPASTDTSPPVSPLPVQVELSLTEQDIALASVPGQGAFNPAAHTFTEDELKPQPMIKKSKKVFVPEDLKDEKYWARRKKNNFAAKRSRDARRVKENQIAMRAAYLEKENTTLKEEMDKIRRENTRLKHRLSKYEAPGTSH